MAARKPQAGDVYVTTVPDGRYGVVRVIRVIGMRRLVSTSTYLGRDRPSLDDPLIRTTVSQSGFPATMWLDGSPPSNFELLGRIRQTGAEAQQECNLYGGKWHTSTGNETYLEWRWRNDRDAFIEDRQVTQAQAAALLRVSQPRVSDLVRGKIDRFSIDTLVEMLGRVGVAVDLVLRPRGAPSRHRSPITPRPSRCRSRAR